jgi:lipopolysaccharide heptosyltransferase II
VTDFRTNIKRIILFRTDRLGDLVLAFPVVDALRASFPRAEIDLYVNPATARLARMHVQVSQVLTDRVHGLESFFALVRFLKTQHYDLAIHLYPRPQLALATLLACIPVRVGTTYRYYSFSFNRRVKMHRKTMAMHEADSNLRLVESFAAPAPPTTQHLQIPEEALQQVRDLLSSKGLEIRGNRFVILHPGSGGSSLNWPPEHFAELGNALVSRGFPVVLTGTELDRPVVHRVRSLSGEGVLDLCGELDLEHMTALLSEASLLVSNSTGPLHLADTLGKKVIGLYSPFLFSSPVRWGPYRQPENVFMPARDTCTKCTEARCKEYNCMASIQPQTVFARALEILCRED